MKKNLLVFVVALSVCLIVLSAFVQVNHSSTLPTMKNDTAVADGIPMPPPPPNKKPTARVAVADGIPMPPPPPNKKPTAHITMA